MSQVAFGNQRRSLILVSVVLIMYFIAGIEFTPETFFLSIMHENVIYVSVWLAFFYFWWRFYQFGADDQRCWKMDFLYELSKNRSYRKLYQQPETEGHDQHMVWAPAACFALICGISSLISKLICSVCLLNPGLTKTANHY